MMDDPDRVASPQPAAIDSTFRNGSLAAIGIIAAFSLGFLTQWSSLPGTWGWADIIALLAITTGISLQIRSLYSFLAIECLIIENYRKGVRTFRNGLITTAFGVALAIFGDLIGLESMIFR